MFGDLVLSHCISCGGSENAVHWTAVIAELCQLCLDVGNRWITHWFIAVYAVAVVVGFYIGVVTGIIIVRVIVIGVVGIVVPWEESGIQAAPETIDEDKEAIMIKVGVPPIPVTMPVAAMTFGDMSHD